MLPSCPTNRKTAAEPRPPVPRWSGRSVPLPGSLGAVHTHLALAGNAPFPCAALDSPSACLLPSPGWGTAHRSPSPWSRRPEGVPGLLSAAPTPPGSPDSGAEPGAHHCTKPSSTRGSPTSHHLPHRARPPCPRRPRRPPPERPPGLRGWTRRCGFAGRPGPNTAPPLSSGCRSRPTHPAGPSWSPPRSRRPSASPPHPFPRTPRPPRCARVPPARSDLRAAHPSCSPLCASVLPAAPLPGSPAPAGAGRGGAGPRAAWARGMGRGNRGGPSVTSAPRGRDRGGTRGKCNGGASGGRRTPSCRRGCTTARATAGRAAGRYPGPERRLY